MLGCDHSTGKGSTPMILPISLSMASAAALVHFWLAIRCIQIRMKARVSIDDGGVPQLQTRMRAHANFNENVPLFLILLALVEAGGGGHLWLWFVGIFFVLARICHAFGMDRPAPNILRAGGMLVSFLLMLVLVIYAVTLSYAQPMSLLG